PTSRYAPAPQIQVNFRHQIRCANLKLPSVPGWRNWQTQRTQNPPVLSTLGVQLPLPAPRLPLCYERATRSRGSNAFCELPFGTTDCSKTVVVRENFVRYEP